MSLVIISHIRVFDDRKKNVIFEFIAGVETGSMSSGSGSKYADVLQHFMSLAFFVSIAMTTTSI